MKKILLLDDDMDTVQVVKEILTYEQYEVKGITYCTGFLNMINDFEPDLIILDYCLTDDNGGELCLEIKAHPIFNHIPVIIFTAYTLPRLDFGDYGCDALISKPFDLENMVQVVNELTMNNLKKLQ